MNGSYHGNYVPRVANTSNLWFDQLEGEALVIALDLKGVAVSGGSACHSGATEPSHVLMAMGRDKARARARLRFSRHAGVDFALGAPGLDFETWESNKPTLLCHPERAARVEGSAVACGLDEAHGRYIALPAAVRMGGKSSDEFRYRIARF